MLSDATFRPITVVCGHYGSGKTTVSLNLASFRKENVTLIDLDVVNPHFRSSDHRKELEQLGIQVISPNFAGSMLDIPSLDPSISGRLISPNGFIVIDAGGDDAGATALGCFSSLLQRQPYDLLYVVNQNRPLTANSQDAAQILDEIERACRLKATGIVNNTHCGRETTIQLIEQSFSYASDISRLTGLPIRCTTIQKQLAGRMARWDDSPQAGVLFPIDLPVQPPW